MKHTIQSRFEESDRLRQTTLQRIRECASLTIPSVLPPEGHTSDQDLPQPWQSLGQRGVTNLEGRLTAALFPASQPWFEIRLSDPARSGLEDEAARLIDDAMWVRTMTVFGHMNGTRYRTAMRERIRHMLFGESLARLMPNYKQRVYRFDQYVVHRSSDGQWQHIITKEKLDPRILHPEDFARSGLDPGLLNHERVQDREVDLYTFCERQDGSFVITQEVNEHEIGSKEEKVSSFLLARYESVVGEHHGRGLIEHLLPDLKSFNSLEESIISAAAACARILIGVDPAGNTDKAEIANADNGAIITAAIENGRFKDVGILQLDKFPDLRVTVENSRSIEARLSKAFLLESELQPRGDRVTAFQVQRIAQELDGALGGVYATIADELQVPFLKRYMHQMESDGFLPRLPDEARKRTQTKMLTGLEALGKEEELQRLLTVLQVLSTFPGFEQRINADEVNSRVTRLRGVDGRGLMLSDEEVARKQQAEQNQELAAMAAQRGIDALGQIVESQVTGQQ